MVELGCDSRGKVDLNQTTHSTGNIFIHLKGFFLTESARDSKHSRAFSHSIKGNLDSHFPCNPGKRRDQIELFNVKRRCIL